MTSENQHTPETTPPSRWARISGWLDRHPGQVSFNAALGFYGCLQAVVILGFFESLPDPAMGIGLAKLGIGSGILTVLFFTPFALVVQRFLPAWRRGDRRAAHWSVFVGLTAALSAWLVTNRWLSGHLFPDAAKLWILAAVTIAAALLVPALFQPAERWRRALALLLPLSVVFVFLPIGPQPPGDDAEERDEETTVTATADPQAPDVVLVTLDTVRADRLGTYGGSLTPEIDALAAEGVVFERTLAAAPWTVPSVASILTGLPSLAHGAGLPISSGFTFFRRTPLEAEHTTLAERFAAAGYRTRAVLSNGFLNPDMGFTQGIEAPENLQNNLIGAYTFRDLPLVRLILSFIPPEKLGDYRAEGLTARALEVLAEDGEEPLFLWVHYIDPHTPFLDDPSRLDPGAFLEEMEEMQPEVMDDGTVVDEAFTATSRVRGGTLWLKPEDKRRIADYYDRAVAYLDAGLGPLFDALRERDGDGGRGVVLAVVSDHGEELWDHGHFEHGHDYYREVTQVPFIVWGPGIVPAGRRVKEVVGHVDVAATLLELAGLEAPAREAADEGRSLVALFDGDGAEPDGAGSDGHGNGSAPPRFCGGNLYGLPAVLIEEGPWRFILRANGLGELYDVTQDPGERYNVAVNHPEIVARYSELLTPRLNAFLAQEGGEEAKISPETLKTLQSLGYVN